MSDNTARKLFQNEDTIQSIKKGTDISTVNQILIRSVDEIVSYIAYWEKRCLKANPDQLQAFKNKIAKAEAFMDQKMDLSIDVSFTLAEAYLDSRGPITLDSSIENVLQDVAKKGKNQPALNPPPHTFDDAENEESISIFDGKKEVKTPTFEDLRNSVKVLLKKGRQDTALLMAKKYLSVGNYIPQKGANQTPEKYTEKKITSWLKDLSNNLMEEKRTDVKPVVIKKKDAASAANVKTDHTLVPLTAEETESLRLLNNMIPDSIAGHGDPESRREVIGKYMNIGANLEKENASLTAFAKRIAGTFLPPKLPEDKLAAVCSDIDKFSKEFFAKRPYTAESILTWREAVKADAAINHFLHLKESNDIDPLKMKHCNIPFGHFDLLLKTDVEAKMSLADVIKKHEGTILHSRVEDENNKHNVYTKLHAHDLIERLYSVHATIAKATTTPKTDAVAAKTIIKTTDKSLVDISEVRLLLKTLAEAGAEFDPDVKQHPEILNLIERPIKTDPKVTPLKFAKDDSLYSYLEPLFTAFKKNIKVKTNEEVLAATERKYADLDNMIILCECAVESNMTVDDFVKDQKDLLIDADGKYMSLQSVNPKGGSKTISIAHEQDFKTWVDQTFKAMQAKKVDPKKAETKKEEPKKTDKPAENKSNDVKSLKELKDEADKILDKGTTYENFQEYLMKNLLNRTLKGQKPGAAFKTLEAVVSFMKSTWGKRLPTPVSVNPNAVLGVGTKTDTKVEPGVNSDIVVDPIIPAATAGALLTYDEIIAQITEDCKNMDEKSDTLFALSKKMKQMFVDNDVKVNNESVTSKQAYAMIADIAKVVNIPMYDAWVERQAKLAEQKKNQPELNFDEKSKNAEAANEQQNKNLIDPHTPGAENKLETTAGADQVIADNVNSTPEMDESAVNQTETTVDVEHKVFEMVDVAKLYPTLWTMISQYKTIEEVYNQAVEFEKEGKFNEGLSMALTILPKIEASKEWDPEYIQNWYNMIVLNKTPKDLGKDDAVITDPDTTATEQTSSQNNSDTTAETAGAAKSADIGTKELSAISDAADKKSYERAIAEILKKHEDTKELRALILNAIKTGTGAEPARRAKGGNDTELYNSIAKIKKKSKYILGEEIA